MRFNTYFVGCLLITISAGCHNDDTHKEADLKQQTEHHDDEIILSAEKARAAGVEVTELQPSDFTGVIKTGGRIMPSSGGESSVVATAPGIIRRSKDYVEGMSVSKGTPLFTVTTSAFPEGDVVSKAKIEFEKAAKELERARRLREDKLMTEQEFQEKEAAYALAAKIYEATGGASSGKGIVITAPMSGYVKMCDVKDGDYVETGSTLMTITQDRKLYLRADVPERYYDKLGSVTSAKFRTGYSDMVYRLSDLDGRKVSGGKGTSDSSPFVPVTFEFTNTGGVTPGSYAEIYLLTERRPDVLAVPLSALTEEQGVKFVYVRVDEEGYEKREVITGEDDGERVEIKSGVTAGEDVVTSGAVHVRLASAAASIPEHNHNH